MILLNKLIHNSIFCFVVILGFTPSYAKSIAEKNWQKALTISQSQKDQSAKLILDKLIKTQHSPIDLDRLYLTRARWYYQNNKFKEAVDDYSKVTKGTDYWIQALEERAWAHLRLNDTNQALAQLKTLLNDLLAPQVGPEAYLLSSLIKLKICDYPGVLKEIKYFKERYKDRSTEIQSLARGQATKHANKVMEMIEQGSLDWTQLKRDVQYLPLLFHRDKELTQLANVAKSKGAISKQNIKSKVQSRLKTLAERDLKEINRVLNKLHLVEVEAIQRIFVAEDAPEGNAQFSKKPDGETLNFPYNGEVWLDELDNYQVATKSCQGFGGKAL